MTIFGSDISSYQAGLDVAHLPDAFVLMKCTEDVSYVDADYAGWLAATKSAGKVPIAYHFIGPSDPAKQAAHLAAHIIDPSVWVMVDFEDEGPFHPTLAQLLALDDAIKAAKLRVVLNYFPRWKWGNLGSPSLAGLTQRRIGLVSSSYPNLTVAPAGQVYAAAGGDNGPGWAPYGGVTPLLWQFTDRATDGGQQVDMNAFRGTTAQLVAALGGTTPTPTPTPEEVDMTPAESEMLAEIHTSAVNYANWQFYAPPGREQVQGTHAWRMQSTLDNTVAISGKLDQLLARQAPTIDVNALAEALAPHLAAGATADQLAAAVLHHLSADTAAG